MQNMVQFKFLTMPCLTGYDIASLAQEPADFDRYFNYELLHGRWAMLGGLGALVPGAC